MSPNDWDNFGGNNPSTGTGGPEGDDFDDPFGPPTDEEQPASEDEWMEDLMDEVQDELSDLAALRRTSERLLEGEVDENIWLTLEFQLSDLPGPGATEAIMTYTIEGNGETQTGKVEFSFDEPLTFAREDARERIEEALELHPDAE